MALCTLRPVSNVKTNAQIAQDSVEQPNIHVSDHVGEDAAVAALTACTVQHAQSAYPAGGTLHVLRVNATTRRLEQVISNHAKRCEASCRVMVLVADRDADATVALVAAGADDVMIEPVAESLLGIRIHLQARALHALGEQHRENARLQNRVKSLTQLALIDPLTGIANRRAFDRALRREWARHLRHQRCLSLLFCDIDFFKAYNDTFGHPHGDYVLGEVASIVQQQVHRDTDLVARYGGEEFTVLLSETSTSGAITVAEEIRAAVAESKFDLGSRTQGRLTVSIGVVPVTPRADLSVSALLECADRDH